MAFNYGGISVKIDTDLTAFMLLIRSLDPTIHAHQTIKDFSHFIVCSVWFDVMSLTPILIPIISGQIGAFYKDYFEVSIISKLCKTLHISIHIPK